MVFFFGEKYCLWGGKPVWVSGEPRALSKQAGIIQDEIIQFELSSPNYRADFSIFIKILHFKYLKQQMPHEQDIQTSPVKQGSSTHRNRHF